MEKRVFQYLWPTLRIFDNYLDRCFLDFSCWQESTFRIRIAKRIILIRIILFQYAFSIWLETLVNFYLF